MKNKTIIFYDFEATSVARDADPISLGLLAIQPTYYYLDDDGCATFDVEQALALNKELHYFSTANTDIQTFYCEFTDYNVEKCDNWVKNNIVNKLYLEKTFDRPTFTSETVKGNQEFISNHLKKWVAQFEDVCFIADFNVIDKPMLIDLIADWDKQSFNEFGKKLDYKYCGKSHELRPYDTEEKSFYYENQDGCDTYKTGLPKHLPNIRYDQFFDLHTIFWLKGIDTDINREEFAGIENSNKHNALADCYTAWECYKKLMKI